VLGFTHMSQFYSADLPAISTFCQSIEISLTSSALNRRGCQGRQRTNPTSSQPANPFCRLLAAIVVSIHRPASISPHSPISRANLAHHRQQLFSSASTKKCRGPAAVCCPAQRSLIFAGGQGPRAVGGASNLLPAGTFAMAISSLSARDYFPKVGAKTTL